MNTILITGANRGLGLEFVRQYAADGWAVIACCRNPQKAEALSTLAAAAKDKNIRIETLTVTEPESIDELKKKLKDQKLDLLINNAGVFSGTGKDGKTFSSNDDDPSQSFGTLNPEAWDRVLRANAIAPIMVTQTLAANMTKGGKIIMITSRMGSIAMAEEGDIAYRSSKAALNAAMHNIAITLKAQNIIVTSMHPGWVQTDMGGAYANLKPEQSINGMRKVIRGLTMKECGQFFGYDGKVIPW